MSDAKLAAAFHPATGPRYRIIGLDLSLTGTGVARVVVGADIKSPTIHLRTIGSASTPKPSYPLILERLRGLARRILDEIERDHEPGEIIVVAFEGPIMGGTTGVKHVHTRAGLWWLLYHLIEKRGLEVVVEPTRLKRYITGKGNAPKEDMVAAAARNFPDLYVANDNEADALGLAQMVARELGFPMEPSVQRVTPNALDGVDWPDHITQRRTARGI